MEKRKGHPNSFIRVDVFDSVTRTYIFSTNSFYEAVRIAKHHGLKKVRILHRHEDEPYDPPEEWAGPIPAR